MSVITPDLAARPAVAPRVVVPCLTADPVAGRIIGVLFVGTVLLFMLAVFALAA